MPIPKTPAPTTQQRPLLREIAAEKIREVILDGTLEPGEPLHDKELQEWLGFSRTPIRDALNELARSGLVEMEPNRYTRVATIHEHESLEALRALGVLLGGIIRLALRTMTEVERVDAVQDLEAIGLDYASGDITQARLRVTEFWTRMTGRIGNAQLQRIYRDAMSGLFYKVPVEYFVRLSDRQEVQCQQRILVEAVRVGDASAAEQAIERIYQLR